MLEAIALRLEAISSEKLLGWRPSLLDYPHLEASARPFPLCLVGAHSTGSSRPRGKQCGLRGFPANFGICTMGTGHLFVPAVLCCVLLCLNTPREALNSADQSAWHIAQRMQKPSHLKKWEKAVLKTCSAKCGRFGSAPKNSFMIALNLQVVFKGVKPDEYEARKQAMRSANESPRHKI